MAALHLQLCLLAIFVVCTKGSYMFSDTIMLNNGSYNVSYNFNESADAIQVLLEVNTTGWVGFGFALNAPNSMVDYDVAVGGVLPNGTGYLQDYFTVGRTRPPLDTQQDWMLISSNEQDGVTTLNFYRARNTTDEKDIAIERGEPIFLIWAYHSSNDAVEPGQFDQHSNSERGVLQRTLIPALTSTVSVSASSSTMVGTMSTSMAEMTTSSMAAMTTSTMEAMTTLTMAAMTTPTMTAMTTSTMAAMTTPTMAEMTTSTMAAMTTSAMEAMTTLTMAALTTSTIAETTTSTTPNITPTTTIPSAASSSVVTPTPTPERPEHFANFISENNGNYNASWMFNINTDTLHFMVEVRATGWVGFGVANQAPNNMVGYDVAVAGVRSGSGGYIKDYFTNGRNRPPVDSQEDWMLSYSREENGVTTLRFYRKRDTNDEKDVVIQQGMSLFLIWAYHSTDDVQLDGQFSQHNSMDYRGVRQVTLIPHFGNFVSLDNGNYNASWMFNSSMDTLHFVVEVRATGWVGFGVATQAPNNMMDYDVAVGGVLNGAGYLKDYYTNSYEQPPEDTQQDWKLTYSREVNDITTLRFYRKLDTKDEKDVAIQQGKPIFLIWAYHLTNDVQTSGQFGKHDRRGSSPQQVTLVPAFTHCYDSGRFCLLWRFDDQKDKMYFHLRVKTTGWVGFGFAETAPNNMMNYDVIVGGFRNSIGYINDYFTQGRAQPVPDSSQNYALLGASEEGGYTELMFERPRDTNDDEDLLFMPGRGVFLIWAYDDMDTTDERTFNIHSNRGVSPDKVVLVSEQPIPTEAAASSLQASFCGMVFLTILLWF